MIEQATKCASFHLPHLLLSLKLDIGGLSAEQHAIVREIKKFFTMQMVQQSEGATWDEESAKYMSPNDAHTPAQDMEDPDHAFFFVSQIPAAEFLRQKEERM